MKNAIFYLGLGTLFTHELDAMVNHEWRILPLTSWLPEESAMIVFLLAHIPLFAGIIALVASKNEKIRFRSQLGTSIFMIIHGLLHVVFKDSSNYEFTTSLSNLLIYSGLILGSIYLFLEYRGKLTSK